MKTKTMKIIYWVLTGLFAAFMLFGGITELMRSPEAVAAMERLGYASQVLIILGVAKIIGAVCLLQTKSRTLREWAYAGFAIDLVGAAGSIYLAGDGILMTLFIVPFLAWLFVSYWLWKKLDKAAA